MGKPSFHRYGIIVWIFAVLFFLYEFFLRVMPATISVDILQSLDLSLNRFALISSAYYITYSLMQVPVGVLIDRFGVRILSSIACVICSIGVVSFSFSWDFYNAIIARLLIGFGSSFGFVSLLTLAFNWFPRRYFGFLSGLGQTLGAIGPLTAGAPVVFMMQETHNDWRLLFLWVAGFGFLLSVLMFLFIRNKPSDLKEGMVFEMRGRSLTKDLKILLKNRDIWITMFYTGFTYVSLPLLGAYWGTVYLQTQQFSKSTAGFLISMIWVGLAIGSPLFGKISDKIKRRKPVLAFLGFAGAIISSIFLFAPVQSQWGIALLLLLMGMATGGQSLAFPLITEYVPEELKATAMGANNTAVMLFAALLPPAATTIIQSRVGTGTILHPDDFTVGFLLMPIAYALSGFIALLGIKETFCKPLKSR